MEDAVANQEQAMMHSLAIPNEIRQRIRQVKPFGPELFCIILDKSWIFSYCTPQVTFMSSIGVNVKYHVTDLPETQHIVGLETCFETESIVICHHNRISPGDTLAYIEIYSVDSEYIVTLQRVVSTRWNCSIKSSLSNFASPKVGEYVLLWGALGNDSYFSTFHVTLNSAVQIQTDFMRTDEKNFKLPFVLLDEVYPGPSQSLFSCQVFAAGEKTHDRITVHMYHIEMNTDDYAPQFATHPSTVFSSVIKLPFKLDPVPKTHKKNKLSLYASIEGMLHKEDGTDRALLRVCTQSNNAECDHAITYLLLHLQDNAVLDVFVSDAYGVCCMNNAGESLMRFERDDIPDDL